MSGTCRPPSEFVYTLRSRDSGGKAEPVIACGRPGSFRFDPVYTLFCSAGRVPAGDHNQGDE